MNEAPPTDIEKSRLKTAKSLVLVNTGDGKGKTTAAMGVMIRAAAMDWKVAVVQFLKSGDWHSGEEKVADKLGVDWWSIGDGFTWDSDSLDESAAIAKEAWSKGKSVIESGDYRLVILDEITYAMTWGWIDTAEVVSVIGDRPQHVNVIVTGRDCPELVIDMADTVTEMRSVKHAFDQGIAAKKGIDY